MPAPQPGPHDPRQPDSRTPGPLTPDSQTPDPQTPAAQTPAALAAAGTGRYRREPFLLAACVLLLLLATIPPLINLGRFQHRIQRAISRSVGRPVGMDSISLRLLPWPAFEIENLVVGEDPAFGSEPALRAPAVVVEPRLSSLWRGRFELSRVELSDASVNLVRAKDGRWNISSVLLQASHVANAPTGQPHAGSAPRFPYIEATSTRINFKRGVEKLPYSLLNADFTMWLAEPTVWQLRLEGQPVRTDLELSLGDTGLLRLEGELHRASAFGTMPLHLRGSWRHAPLGQLSRLLLGRDAGWRGDIDATGSFDGEMNQLDIHSHLVIANLHRQEFTPDQPLTLDATCQSVYSHSSPAQDATSCRWPLGAGALRLVHAAQAAPGAATLYADAVPSSFLLQALALLRPSAPSPQSVAGAVSGRFDWDPVLEQLSGSVATPELTLLADPRDATGTAALSLHHVVLRAGPGPQPLLLLTTDPVAMGIAAMPMQLAAEFSPHGYTLHASGTASLVALENAAAAMHLPGPRSLSAMPVTHLPAPVASIGLTLAGTGSWIAATTADTAPASASGSLRLQNVAWQPSWLPFPVMLPLADAALAPGMIRWTIPAATLGPAAPERAGSSASASSSASGIGSMSGSVQVPLACAVQATCPTQFTLATPTLDAGRLESLLTGHQPLLAALLSRMDATEAARVHLPIVTGSIHAGVLTLGRLAVRDASLVLSTVPAPVAPEAGAAAGPRLHIESLDGHALGGSLHLQGDIALSGSGPLYILKAAVAGASVAEAAALWHESWGSGTLGGTASFSLGGTSTAELLSSVRGDVRASWTQGGLVRSSGLPAQLLRFSSWDAAGTLSPAGLDWNLGSLSGGGASSAVGDGNTVPPASATLTGRIGFDRGLALRFTPAPGQASVAIGGSLGAPDPLAAPNAP